MCQRTINTVQYNKYNKFHEVLIERRSVYKPLTQNQVTDIIDCSRIAKDTFIQGGVQAREKEFTRLRNPGLSRMSFLEVNIACTFSSLCYF